MGCTPGVTVSPGYLTLEYNHVSQSLHHQCRSRLIFGQDPMDSTLMKATADAWAAVWKAIVTSSFTANAFSVLRLDGTVIYGGSLTAPITGTHTAASGALDYASRTVCFTGRGQPPTPAQCSGNELHRVFIGAALEFTPREKFIVAGVEAAYDAYAAFLATSVVLWADYYGQPASMRGTYPIQFNAYAQGRNGT